MLVLYWLAHVRVAAASANSLLHLALAVNFRAKYSSFRTFNQQPQKIF
jgi:hypothetical protein